MQKSSPNSSVTACAPAAAPPLFYFWAQGTNPQWLEFYKAVFSFDWMVSKGLLCENKPLPNEFRGVTWKGPCLDYSNSGQIAVIYFMEFCQKKTELCRNFDKYFFTIEKVLPKSYMSSMDKSSVHMLLIFGFFWHWQQRPEALLICGIPEMTQW